MTEDKRTETKTPKHTAANSPDQTHNIAGPTTPSGTFNPSFTENQAIVRQENNSPQTVSRRAVGELREDVPFSLSNKCESVTRYGRATRSLSRRAIAELRAEVPILLLRKCMSVPSYCRVTHSVSRKPSQICLLRCPSHCRRTASLCPALLRYSVSVEGNRRETA